MKKDEERLNRLFSDFEKLVDEEEFALRHLNFDYVSTVFTKKDKLLSAIAETSKRLGIVRGKSADWDNRLSHLVQRQQCNLNILGDQMEKNQKEQEARVFEKNRFRGIRRTYASESRGSAGFPGLRA